MHCPRCGQQQVSEEIKYCSRCGFPLGLVSEVLVNDGFLPQLADLHKSKKLVTRKLGLKISLLWFVIITCLLLPLAAITGAPKQLVAALAIIGFVGGLLITLLSWFFLQNETKLFPAQTALSNENYAPKFLAGKRAQTALPPQTSQPVSSYEPPTAGSWKAPDTGDLVAHSVTEGTTRLLQKDE
ncbi:MAG: hypothetical protein ABJA66_01475 [Actinomycetota bacterium]